jgi:3-oxoacyl-[acyl-carrier protein] reductase
VACRARRSLLCARKARCEESPESYAGGDGNFNRLHYQQMDAADPGAIEAFNPPFKKLDVLVQSQGIILYSRGEFEVKGFRRVLEVNLVSLMSCAMKFHPLLVEAQGSIVGQTLLADGGMLL